ncbi:Mitochondrial import inner membrane translocase subunit tim8 [Dinochytrium kinnereticum]|nr:Mitochondrial import inner membrane translocase subunit tim8 [Dinochytrium kinnereticum]
MDQLTDSEKKEMASFVAAEQQRANFQQQVHTYADICWDKCIASSKVKPGLDRSDETCIKNCVDRFIDSSMVIINVFNQAADRK